jgi:hypothetical protein
MKKFITGVAGKIKKVFTKGKNKKSLTMRPYNDIKKEVSEEEIQNYLKDFAQNKLTEIRFTMSLSEWFNDMEERGKSVSDIVVNHKLFEDFRKIGSGPVDITTRKHFIEKGLRAFIWGVRIWVDDGITGNQVRLYAENDTSLELDFPTIAAARKSLNL